MRSGDRIGAVTATATSLRSRSRRTGPTIPNGGRHMMRDSQRVLQHDPQGWGVSSAVRGTFAGTPGRWPRWSVRARRRVSRKTRPVKCPVDSRLTGHTRQVFGLLIGYARVSTDAQDLIAQRDALRGARRASRACLRRPRLERYLVSRAGYLAPSPMRLPNLGAPGRVSWGRESAEGLELMRGRAGTRGPIRLCSPPASSGRSG